MTRLCKGVEVEMYTGTSQGEIVGLSDRITKDLNGFVREPDTRNVEYTTAPLCCYDRLLCSLVRPRQRLREYLQKIGNYTIIPGSTLSLGDSQQFYRSDPINPYHSYIEHTYGADVVTASVHLNIGINDPELLMKACRLVRVEAPLYLALSASSPFLDGQVTGYHSTRWQIFPQTPQKVPLFESHRHFIQWTEEQLILKTMQNVRHLWTSVRPNGHNRPYHLNRLELRICDLIIDPIALLSVIALLESRLLQLIDDPTLDPLGGSQLSPETLLDIIHHNETEAAKHSLEAQLYHWRDGHKIDVTTWIEQIYQEVWPFAQKNGFSCFLSPVKKILRNGNLAQQWLRQYQLSHDIPSIITAEIQTIAQQEKMLEDKLCDALLVA
ncbi:putative glutamate--cysteine ligase [Crocosphaera subtropica ATCC 51142]|uniref:Glutamate--cysteine ligase n=1 Tax=Crocosphaera subtropica (strain ATCC 51142 / BH68) TaxID=43989 RepID=B1WR11_CROS5|nr:glutamate--cysteine ligase [Crocosphaera subtropica]ACB50069.1 putative glutamate--cysteine ligase [Crocosphaera subtropica ATCC 51142]